MGKQYVENIDVPDRLRAVDPAKVRQLAESMKVVGLLNPITVYYPDESTCILIAGAHRLEGAKLLGWESIEVIELQCDTLTAQLAEIDENLCRSELTPAQYASHVARRKEVWEAMRALQSEQFVPIESRREDGKGHREEGFASETSKATGQSKQDVNRHIARAEALGDDINEVVGTSLDKGVELDALKALPQDERRELIDRAKAGEHVSARSAEREHDRDRNRRVVEQALSELDRVARSVPMAEVLAILGRADIKPGAAEIAGYIVAATVEKAA